MVDTIVRPFRAQSCQQREESDGGHAVLEMPMTVQSLLSCPNLTRLNASQLSRNRIEFRFSKSRPKRNPGKRRSRREARPDNGAIITSRPNPRKSSESVNDTRVTPTLTSSTFVRNSVNTCGIPPWPYCGYELTLAMVKGRFPPHRYARWFRQPSSHRSGLWFNSSAIELALSESRPDLAGRVEGPTPTTPWL